MDEWEIDDTAREICSKGHQRIALQFPDELLCISVPIFMALKKALSLVSHTSELYILSDTPSSACCVDEVGAQHVQADFIVHYGRACLSRVSGDVDVKWVFGKSALGEDCLSKIWDAIDKFPRLVIYADTNYQNALLDSDFRFITCTTTETEGSTLIGSRWTKRSTEHVLYIGQSSMALTQLILQLPHVIQLDPESMSLTDFADARNDALNRRYMNMFSAKDKDVYGLVVGSFNKHSVPILHNLQLLMKKHNKKYYTLSVGRMTGAKLDNFDEIQAFVLITCAESQLMTKRDVGIDKPIITPFELLLVLGEREWNGSMTSDVELASKTLISENETNPTEWSLLKRDPGTMTKYSLERTFQGLDLQLDKSEPATLIQGRKGIASGYNGH